MKINIISPIPGPKSREIMAELAEYESPAITARQLSRAKVGGIDCPIVWAKTSDVFVEDVDGNCFMDLTAGFGVASVGHAHPDLVKAAQQQMAEMPHAMGDAFPGQNKMALLKKLAQIAPGNLKRSLLANSGFEAVEVALKTAMIKTGKPGIIAFENAYHGLGYGALAVTSYRDRFREPFLSQLNPHVHRLPYPTEEEANQSESSFVFQDRASMPSTLPSSESRRPSRQKTTHFDLSPSEEITRNSFADLLEKTIIDAARTNSPIGALIIEPILGRGGIIEAPIKSLQQIREITSRHGIVMIVDEICTGFGRTGDWFAIEKAGIIPDLLCLGKGMNGGFPISAAIGTDDVMSGWGDAQGEAIHTSTFLGNPVGCAMALKCIDLLEKGLLEQSKPMGDYFKTQLLALQKQFPVITGIRGRGLMLGIAFENNPNKNVVLLLSKALLQRGFIALPCGLHGDVLSLTPSLTIQKEHIDDFVNAMRAILAMA